MVALGCVRVRVRMCMLSVSTTKEFQELCNWKTAQLLGVGFIDLMFLVKLRLLTGRDKKRYVVNMMMVCLELWSRQLGPSGASTRDWLSFIYLHILHLAETYSTGMG